MKKFLLLTAVSMSLGISGYAQKSANIKVAKEAQTEYQSVNRNAMISCEKSAMTSKSVINKVSKDMSAVSRRSVDNGVYYKKPEGTYYLGGTSQSGGKFSYMIVPALTNIILQNKCTDKANATWSVGANTYPGNDDNDFEYGWIPADDGVYTTPTITVGSDSYSFCSDLDSKGLVASNDIFDLSILNNGLCTTYYAWSDSYSFGVDTKEDDGKISKMGDVYQDYPKPLKPLYLSSVWFKYYSVSKTPIPEGKKMKMTIYKLNDEGKVAGIYASMPITSANATAYTGGDGTQGYFEVPCTVVDEDGFESASGVVIDSPFTVMISGFDQEGIDFGIMMTNVAEDPIECYWNGGVFPTIMEYYDEAGEYAGGMYYYNSERKAQYNAAIYLSGMYDVVDAEGFENLIAPEEGGSVYAALEEGNYNFQVYTTLPWTETLEDETTGNDNYTIEGVPSWITVEEIVVPSNAEEGFNSYIIPMTAEALPAGTTGRSATIRVVSAKGADSGEITICQGEVTGINVTTKTVKTAETPAFNLAGQRVDKNYKGIVVKNGNKFIVK